MVILTNSTGIEIRPINFIKFDCDLNSTRDFILTISASEWRDDLAYGNRIIIPGTEYGGIIGAKKTTTAENTVTISGLGWRGILYRKIIKPPAGQAYKTVSGELNDVLAQLISEAGISDLFSVSEEQTGVSLNGYQFDRYITLLDGIHKMLKSVGYRLEVKYIEVIDGAGYVQLSAAEITDYSASIELSQDDRLDFTFDEQKNGINHLVCLGKGELNDRVVVDLYVQGDGTIGTHQYFTGLKEVAATYENVAAEDAASLTEYGTEELERLTSKQTFKMNVERLSIDVEIGDIIGGRDYITGMNMNKPVINKIYTSQNGIVTKEYTLEGEEQ